jgi:hypothetical protein
VAPVLVWTCAKNIVPYRGIRSQDSPVRSQSLYRLSYPGPYSEKCTGHKCIVWETRGRIFRRFRIVAKSTTYLLYVCLSVLRSACIIAASNVRTCMTFFAGTLYEKSVEKIKCLLKSEDIGHLTQIRRKCFLLLPATLNRHNVRSIVNKMVLACLQ